MASIYGLIGEDGELRYIGKANNPIERLKVHYRDTRRRTTPLHNWLRKHGAAALLVLETCCDDWEKSERDWISAARRAGCGLLNVADGGAMPCCSRQTRADNGRKNALAILSSPRRKRIRDIKSMVVRELRSFERNGYLELAERTRSRMRRAASERPDIFGDWAHV